MIIAFRHGTFALNRRSHLTGEAAHRAMEQPIPPDADAIMDLLPEGREQAQKIQNLLADMSIYACLRSKTWRTKTMAQIALGGQLLPGGIHIEPALRERSRGKFSYAPDAWADQQPDFPARKSVLDWIPAGVDYRGIPGESIRQVRDTLVKSVLRRADEVAPHNAVVAFSTHAEWMGALRAYYLGFDDERFRQPLIPNPPQDNPALMKAKMVVNGQVDMFDCTCPKPVPYSSPQMHMDIFRTVITKAGLEFDTGWLPVAEVRQPITVV